MRYSNYIIIAFLMLALPVFSQQKIDMDLKDQPVLELLKKIEAASPYQIFCVPSEMDSVKVSVTYRQEDPLTILQAAFANTPYQISKYENYIFILKNKKLMTYLPENMFGSKQAYNIMDSTVYSTLSLINEHQDRRAISEFKIYEVGNPSQKTSGKANLTGYVLDMKTGEPVPGVSVYIEGTSIATMTDTYGYYSLSVSPGRHELSISGAGQKETKRQILLHSEGRLDIQSVEKVYALREVTVQADRKDNIKQTTMGVERLKMKEIKNVPTVFGESDILRVVMMLPGVKSVGEISSGFNVRGGATDQNLILYNDGTIYNPTHMFGLFSAFNPDIVKDMELYKSSIPSKYGGRISSVLDINGREGNNKEFHGAASIGLLTSRLAVEGPIVKEKGSFILGGRTTYSDWLLKQLPEKSGYKDGNANFYDINLGITHKFDERNTIYASGYYSQDNFRFQQDEKYGYRNGNGSLKWRHVFSPKVTGVFTAGYDHYDYNIRNVVNPPEGYKLEFVVNQMYGKADLSWYYNNEHTFNFGFNSLHYNLNPGTITPNGDESIILTDQIQKEKALESAFYIGDQWNVNSKLAIDFGIRYSIFNVLGTRSYNLYDPGSLPSEETVTETVDNKSGILKTYHGPEFRLSARYAFSDDLSVKAGVNTMRQYIHKISNTAIMSPTDTWKLSDVNIKPQKGVQFAVGVYKNFYNNILEASIETYYKTMDDYLDYRSGAKLIMNHNLERDVLNTKGRAYGVELMLKKTAGKLNGWVSYTYSRTQLKQDDERISIPVNRGEWYSADFDKPHEFKFISNYKFTHRFSFSLNCEYTTGRPVTLPISKYVYADKEYVYYSDRNKYRVPDYFRMDVSFNIEPSHHLTLLTHSMISFGVYNVTGRKNAHSVYYQYEDGLIKGYKLAIFGVPIPYLSYNIKF
ncbi:TonB-dependent receptor [Dysgonomonas hofstadii]|nr:TonB-dependent receptor [Dysgonomonas hofstadii]